MTSLRGRHHPGDFYEDRKNHSGRGRASRADLSKGHSRDHQRRIKPLMPELNEVCGAFWLGIKIYIYIKADFTVEVDLTPLHTCYEYPSQVLRSKWAAQDTRSNAS